MSNNQKIKNRKTNLRSQYAVMLPRAWYHGDTDLFYPAAHNNPRDGRLRALRPGPSRRLGSA